ncbi:MAG: hypothetical protein ACREF8_05505 [Chthoniobacterales bacterium]
MESTIRALRLSLTRRWRGALARRPNRHDPMLVLNMSIFNFESGWNRILSPVKTYENVP